MPKYGKAKWMPNYSPSEDERRYYTWGLNNGVFISPDGISGDADHWYIAVKTKTGWKRGKFKYDRDTIWPELYNAYKYYYDKKNNKL